MLNGEKLKKSISDPLISSFLLLSSVAHVWPVLFNAGTDMTQIPILYFDFCPGFVKYIKTKLICFWNNKHRYLYSSAKCASAISNVIYTLKHVFTQAALVWPKFALLQQNWRETKQNVKMLTTAQPNYLNCFVIFFHVMWQSVALAPSLLFDSSKHRLIGDILSMPCCRIDIQNFSKALDPHQPADL